jgi:hypothetical protein
VYAFGEPVDMRKSFNTRSALVVGLGREVLCFAVAHVGCKGREFQF